MQRAPLIYEQARQKTWKVTLPIRGSRIYRVLHEGATSVQIVCNKGRVSARNERTKQQVYVVAGRRSQRLFCRVGDSFRLYNETFEGPATATCYFQHSPFQQRTAMFDAEINTRERNAVQRAIRQARAELSQRSKQGPPPGFVFSKPPKSRRPANPYVEFGTRSSQARPQRKAACPPSPDLRDCRTAEEEDEFFAGLGLLLNSIRRGERKQLRRAAGRGLRRSVLRARFKRRRIHPMAVTSQRT